MADKSLSLAEKTFVQHGIDANLRVDGRERTQYRWMELESNVIDSVNGSVIVRTQDAIVIVATKVEIDTPNPGTPNEGKLEFYVDCSPNATNDIEGKTGDDFATEISEIMRMGYSSPEVFDLKLLSIVPNEKCWILYVDVLILQVGGNLLDAVSIGVKSALHVTAIPRVKNAFLDADETNIVLSDDIHDCIKLDVRTFPVFVTLFKIGDNCIVDATLEEKACTSSSVVLSVTPNGKITSVLKMDHGSLQPTTLCKMMKMGTEVAPNLNKNLMDALKREDDLGPKKNISGFLVRL